MMTPVPIAATPLVGRTRELDELAALAGVRPEPAPGCVLLGGDAGIGKSRLLAALGERATGQGWEVVVGHCLDLAGSPVPYLPFTELAGRLAASRPEAVAELVGRYPSVRRLVGQDTDPVGARPVAGEPAERGLFFEGVHATLSGLGAAVPLLVVVEDLHWADQSTYDLMTFLLTRGFRAPVGLVGSYRSDDLHRRHPLRPLLAAWGRLPGVRRVELGPLPDDDVRALVGGLTGAPASAAELQALVERAEGNAFFAEELAATLGTSDTPRDLADLLLLRVDQLDADARLVCRVLAVAGHRLGDDLLGRVSGLDADRLEAAVRSAVDRNVLVAGRDGYGFRHSMLGEAVEADLLPGERARLHDAFTDALLGQRERGAAADLARHALAAGRSTEALAASVRAGDDAAAVGGPDEAARHYARALDLVRAGRADLRAAEPPVELVDLVERTVAATTAAGMARRAETVAREELERLPPGAAPTDRARLLLALVEAAEGYETTTDELAAAAEAERLVPAEPPTTLRARTVATLAGVLAGERQDDAAVRWAEEGLSMPPELRSGETTALLQTVLAKITERRGDSAESVRVLGELADAARAADDPAEVRLRHQLGAVLLEQGRLVEALDAYRAAASESTRRGRPFAPYGAEARVFAGLVAYQLGRWDEALALARADVEQAPSLPSAGLAAVELLVRAGRGEREGWAVVAGRARPEWSAEGMVAVQSAGAAIDLHGDAGELDEALAVHDEVVATLSALWGTVAFQGRIRLAALLLGQLAPRLGAFVPERRERLLDRARSLVDEAEAATEVGRHRVPGPEGQAWLARVRAEGLRLGWLAGRPTEPDTLVEAWRRSVDAFTAYGQVFEAARSGARLAVVQRAAGDHAGAARTAGQALAVARELGARPLVDEVRPLAGASGSTGPGGDVLTPREAEVLALVADGASNGDIGLRLFISTKTASVHVSNILAKLGARSRTEAVAVARRRGLLG
ncbi:regulatory protein, luxR family [Microlunatus sagamiharensis]|uniref:Regulatory protein, luxR family n=1 Tax=Microlunatus sagamiharensis TaxID=546874 RepID=A0A1H2M4B0_9ACTN|nr:helix-turn-helix transcriptional regulator [Microlunatus sagamiharensis]SDU88107.1 regulatory protein, luxR family [Microlunatus sagamiharensis]